MKSIMLFAILIASLAFGQTANTPRVPFTSNGTYVSTAFVVNSSNSAASVLSGASPYNAACSPTPVMNNPYAYAMYGGETVFNTSMGNWTNPQNIAITSVTFKACYILSGFVYSGTVAVVPIYRNKNTGVIYDGPVLFNVTGPNPPFYSIYYAPGPTTPATASATVTWTFASTGAPNINSADLNSNIEFGFRMYTAGAPWIIPVTDAIKFLGVDIRTSFTKTSAPLILPSAPSATYAPQSTWNQGRLTITQAMPAPSSGMGARFRVRCTDGTFYTLNALGDFIWGTPSPASRMLTISQLNVSCPSNAKLTQGGTVQFQAQPLNGTTAYGNISFSNTITLN